MMYEGKEVWTQENFSYQDVKIGDYVEQAVVDDAMDCLPPAPRWESRIPTGRTRKPGSGRPPTPPSRELAASGRTASGSIAATVSVVRMWNGARTPFTAEGECLDES